MGVITVPCFRHPLFAYRSWSLSITLTGTAYYTLHTHLTVRKHTHTSDTHGGTSGDTYWCFACQPPPGQPGCSLASCKLMGSERARQGAWRCCRGAVGPGHGQAGAAARRLTARGVEIAMIRSRLCCFSHLSRPLVATKTLITDLVRTQAGRTQVAIQLAAAVYEETHG